MLRSDSEAAAGWPTQVPTCAQQAEAIAIVQEGYIPHYKGDSPPQTSSIACRRAEHAINSAGSPVARDGHPHSSLQCEAACLHTCQQQKQSPCTAAPVLSEAATVEGIWAYQITGTVPSRLSMPSAAIPGG